MWAKSESTGSRGFQRVGHVQIVRPCFGPVLPGMGTGVRADKSLLPVSGHPPIVSPQCFGVVLPFVPKEIAKAMDPVTIPYEPVPIVVAALMAEVPQKRAVWFVHLVPPLLALRIIRFSSFAGFAVHDYLGYRRLLKFPSETLR